MFGWTAIGIPLTGDGFGTTDIGAGRISRERAGFHRGMMASGFMRAIGTAGAGNTRTITGGIGSGNAITTGNGVKLRLATVLLACLPCFADPRLDALRGILIPMRGTARGSGGPRGATPQLTIAKHQLRDWVESEVGGLAQTGDERELERKLNAELADADLLCGDDQVGKTACPELTLLGFL